MSEIVCECGHDMDKHNEELGCMAKVGGVYCRCARSRFGIYLARIDNLEEENTKLRAELDELKKHLHALEVWNKLGDANEFSEGSHGTVDD